MSKRLVKEVKLSRVFSKVKDEETPFVILSGFRRENGKEKNETQNKKLMADIRAEGLGFFKVEGSYIENKGTPDEVKVVEKSFFVTGNKNDDGNLKGFAKKMMKKFKQESVVFKPNGTTDVFLLFQNGTQEKLGAFRANKISDYMSRLVQHKNSTFVFENVKYPRNSQEIKGAKIRGEEDYLFKTVWKSE